MASTSINRFLILWENDALKNDVTWRAYNIEAAVHPRYVKRALKTLSLNYAGELAEAQFCVLYEVRREDARFLLAAWWLWSRIAKGGHPRVPLRAARSPVESERPSP